MDVIRIGTALSKLDQDRPLILGGDMNCRIDAPGPKAKLVLRYLQETGLELVNKKDRATYISHNGKSTIDLVFTNRKHIRPVHQSTMPVVIRKHLPVETHFELPQVPQQETTPAKVSRRLALDKLEEAGARRLEQMAVEGKLDEALEGTLEMMGNATYLRRPNTRKSQPWFNAACYSARRMVLLDLHRVKANPGEENTQRYSRSRRIYKNLLKVRKREYQEERDRKKIEEVEKHPYKILNPRKPIFPRDIPIEKWEHHLQTTLQAKDTRPHQTQHKP